MPATPRWLADLAGTMLSYFRIGLTGPRLKNNSGNLDVRNAGDSAYAEVTTSKLNVTDADVVLDSDGNALTISRNAAQSGALQVVMPPAKGTDGYVLSQKAGTGAGVIEFELVSAANTNPTVKVDTTSVAYNSSSPVTAFTLPANAVITKVEVYVDTAFNATGPANMSVGISGTTSKYFGSTDVDLTTVGVYEKNPGQTANGSTEDLIVTFSAGSGGSTGAARVLVHYTTPS